MAKLSSVEKNNRRARMAAKFLAKRSALKATIMDKELSMEERFAAQMKLAAALICSPQGGKFIAIKNGLSHLQSLSSLRWRICGPLKRRRRSAFARGCANRK